ncbi:MAG: diguanylate cyclase [Fimbriimonadaceae bacterium]|nr:diguanylate cyclase [Fimbriimonadaceae bacterium]
MLEPQLVLVAEGDEVERNVLARHLTDLGHRVELAEDGAQALDLLRHRHYPIVVAAWILPQLDGIELTREIRALGGAYTYVVIGTAHSSRSHRLLAFEAGVDDVVGRPFDGDELFSRMVVAGRVLATEQQMRQVVRERDNAQERLRDAHRLLTVASTRFEELFDGLPIACFTFDHDFRIREWNRESEQLFQIPPYLAIDRVVWELFSGKSRKPWSKSTLEKVLLGGNMDQVEWSMTRQDGTMCYMLANIFPLRGMNNEVRGVICGNVDITARKEAEQRGEVHVKQLNVIAMELERERMKLEEANTRLEHMAVTDGLTGLRNRRAFQQLFEEEFEKHLRSEHPLSLILLDVDRFKQLNDHYGHTTGDTVLRELADTLQRTCSVGEFAARYGGEEFVIILPNAGPEHALERAEAFREAIEAHDFGINHVTASFGVATANGKLTDGKKLVDQADEALYESKRRGRNRSTHYRHMIAARLNLSLDAA